ncbi:MAG: cytochrome C oxidase subunit IV family protein [bacterium]|nr:cytochrome C oxidase subunit IV family protein [bacterium]
MSKHQEGPSYAHVVPVRTLLGVFGALMFLTVLTYAVTYVDLGALNIWVALGIALVKGTLVALVFMHLLWDRKFYIIVLVSALLCVMIFIGIALLDSGQYQADLIPNFAPAITP